MGPPARGGAGRGLRGLERGGQGGGRHPGKLQSTSLTRISHRAGASDSRQGTQQNGRLMRARGKGAGGGWRPGKRHKGMGTGRVGRKMRAGSLLEFWPLDDWGLAQVSHRQCSTGLPPSRNSP